MLGYKTRQLAQSSAEKLQWIHGRGMCPPLMSFAHFIEPSKTWLALFQTAAASNRR